MPSSKEAPESAMLALLEDKPLSAEQERKLLASADPEQREALLTLYSRRLRKARAEKLAVDAELAQLRTPPLHPATVLRRASDARVDVCIGGRRQLVVAAPDVAIDQLEPGREVLLASDGSAIVATGPGTGAGGIATVLEIENDMLLVRSSSDEESVVECDPELLAKLSVGDRVLLAAGAAIAVRRLPGRTRSEFELRVPPDVRFEQIGGHEAVLAEIRRDLDLHLIHRERVVAFALQPPRGMLLVGPPGVGKTMIASAIAAYLARHSERVRFLCVPPGALRGVWYGSSEQRIRELFALARAFPGLVVIFLDEIDSFGARGNGAGQDLDGRVLGALLHELQGLGSARDVLVIGATNRIDLCDEALVREGRLGDRRYFFARPDRAAARTILTTRLAGGLPWADPEAGRERALEAALAHLYTPSGGAGVLAHATLGDGRTLEIRARDVVSGAMLASAVERAKHAAAERTLDGGPGLAAEDLLVALDAALDGEARRLESEQAARRTLEHPEARQITRVRVAPGRALRAHRYVRAS